jgi:hypothetical protein
MFSGVFGKPVVAAFDEASQSSDAGLVLLGALDRRLDLTRRLCEPVRDGRAIEIELPCGFRSRERRPRNGRGEPMRALSKRAGSARSSSRNHPGNPTRRRSERLRNVGRRCL